MSVSPQFTQVELCWGSENDTSKEVLWHVGYFELKDRGVKPRCF